MKNYRFKIAIIAYLIFTLAACTQVASQTASADEEPSASELMPMEPALPPQQGDSTPMDQSLPTQTASGKDRIIEIATADLAQRLSISPNQITLVEATDVEWSDSSLGCPQPDMAYLQVITPGYRILLEANGIQYEYHSNRDAYVVYCDNSNPFILPKP